MVSNELISVLQQTPDTWQVDWIETTRNRDGTLKKSTGSNESTGQSLSEH